MLSDIIHGRPARTVDVANRQWLASRNGRLYYYLAFDPRRSTLFDVSVFDTATGPVPALGAHVRDARDLPATAEHAGRWRTAGCSVSSRKPPRATRFAQRPLALGDDIDFNTAQVEADAMTFGELRNYIRRVGASGFSVSQQEVNLQKKLAFPAVTLVMTLLGVPFGVTTGRRGALYGIGLAIVLALGYWLLMTFFIAMGSAAVLPAPLAAWAANILFLAGAVYLMLTVRT